MRRGAVPAGRADVGAQAPLRVADAAALVGVGARRPDQAGAVGDGLTGLDHLQPPPPAARVGARGARAEVEGDAGFVRRALRGVVAELAADAVLSAPEGAHPVLAVAGLGAARAD